MTVVRACDRKPRSSLFATAGRTYDAVPVRNRSGTFGAVAQLGERCVRNAEVVGSNPIGSTPDDAPLAWASDDFRKAPSGIAGRGLLIAHSGSRLTGQMLNPAAIRVQATDL